MCVILNLFFPDKGFIGRRFGHSNLYFSCVHRFYRFDIFIPLNNEYWNIIFQFIYSFDQYNCSNGHVKIKNKTQVVITGITCIKHTQFVKSELQTREFIMYHMLVFYYKERRKEIQSRHLQHFLFFCKRNQYSTRKVWKKTKAWKRIIRNYK